MMHDAERALRVLAREDQRRAGHRPCSLANATIEPVKVMAPIATPRRHLDQAAEWIAPGIADAELARRIERRRGDADRRQADQRVEGRDQLRQRRHLDAHAR